MQGGIDELIGVLEDLPGNLIRFEGLCTDGLGYLPCEDLNRETLLFLREEERK